MLNIVGWSTARTARPSSWFTSWTTLRRSLFIGLSNQLVVVEHLAKSVVHLLVGQRYHVIDALSVGPKSQT